MAVLGDLHNILFPKFAIAINPELSYLTCSFKRRGVAQPGSAPALGAGCRGFKSLRPDQFSTLFLLQNTNKNGVFRLSDDISVRVCRTVFGDGDFPKQPPKQNLFRKDHKFQKYPRLLLFFTFFAGLIFSVFCLGMFGETLFEPITAPAVLFILPWFLF